MTLEEALIEHCAHTLAGVKSAGLFRFSPKEPEQFARQFKTWRASLGRRGISLLVLKRCRRTGSYLLYLYRESALAGELADPQVRAYLAEQGYHAGGSCRDLLRQLAGRLCFQEGFPHEIGLFLSYPPEDVLGFICNRACNHKCVGCWKVYGDEQTAKNIFEKYEMCSKIYSRQWQQGKSIEQLTVAG